jgi:hypothetical protein
MGWGIRGNKDIEGVGIVCLKAFQQVNSLVKTIPRTPTRRLFPL